MACTELSRPWPGVTTSSGTRSRTARSSAAERAGSTLELAGHSPASRGPRPRTAGRAGGRAHSAREGFSSPVMLIALGGLPGVGKSALATSLARRIGAVHLRIDTIEQAMRNAGLNVSGPEGYLAARDLAEDNLRIGHTVIVDSVNPVAITRDYWQGTAARLAVELVEIEVICSDERQHRQRVESRITDIPGLVLPTWQQVLDRHYEPWKTAHVVDTAGRTLEDTLSQAEAIVRRRQS